MLARSDIWPALVKSGNPHYRFGYNIPGGGFISTVEDLAKFAIAMQAGALVKKNTLANVGDDAISFVVRD